MSHTDIAQKGLPLVADYHPERVFAWRDGEAISCGHALAAMEALAARLRPQRAYLNLCEDRCRFTVAFGAVCMAGGVNLLPPNHGQRALADVREQFADCATIDDDVVAGPERDAAEPPASAPAIGARQCVAVVFTSGSTGRPTPHRKYWGDLRQIIDRWYTRFLANQRPLNIAATVPPQHMYGLETSVLPVLHAGFAAHAGAPYLPWEIAETLSAMPPPRLLITTPMHLRTCVQSHTSMPEIVMTISATAPLPEATAREAEALLDAPVCEIYGCTEAGSLASRRVTESPIWTLYEDMRLAPPAAPLLHGPQLPEPIELEDELELLDAQRFRLLGRSQDMLKVGGKRMSLSGLTQRLLELDGVADAAAFVPRDGRRVSRPAALVVAPERDERQLARALAAAIDPVFIPRPLMRVDRLPRNRLGKLPQAELEALVDQRSRSAHGD